MAPKSGIKTSEFWLHALAAVGGVMYMVLAHAPDVRIALVTQALAALYTVARTWLKQKHLGAEDIVPVVAAVQKAVAAVEAQPFMVTASAPTPESPATAAPSK